MEAAKLHPRSRLGWQPVAPRWNLCWPHSSVTLQRKVSRPLSHAVSCVVSKVTREGGHDSSSCIETTPTVFYAMVLVIIALRCGAEAASLAPVHSPSTPRHEFLVPRRRALRYKAVQVRCGPRSGPHSPFWAAE